MIANETASLQILKKNNKKKHDAYLANIDHYTVIKMELN